MKNHYFLNLIFILTVINLIACNSNRKSPARIGNIVYETTNAEQTNTDQLSADEGVVFLTDLYSKIKNGSLGDNFNPYDYLTDRFSFATYECDWNIFLNAQDYPDNYSVSVEKYNQYEDAYLVKIDGGAETWFNSELVYMLVKENNQLYIDNQMDLKSEFGKKWLGNYMKEKEYQETIIFTPSQKAYFKLGWFDIYGWQVMEDIDNDNHEETIILNIYDEDLVMSIRKNHTYYTITTFRGLVKDYRREYTLQLAFYDIDSDDISEILFAIYDNDANSKLYIQKTIIQNGYNATILNALEGQGKYIFNKDTIKVPFGKQGLFETYIYNGDGYSKVDIEATSQFDDVNLDFLYE